MIVHLIETIDTRLLSESIGLCHSIKCAITSSVSASAVLGLNDKVENSTLTDDSSQENTDLVDLIYATQAQMAQMQAQNTEPWAIESR